MGMSILMLMMIALMGVLTLMMVPKRMDFNDCICICISGVGAPGILS